MGPHPETTSPIDVQKYIGSCLITQQQSRSSKRKGPGPPGRAHHHHQQQHHTKEGRYGGGNYAWTGVPLISVATHRHHHQNRRGNGGTNPKHHHHHHHQEYDPPADNMEEIMSISRLAIHAQGAPLILSPPHKEGGESFKGHDFYMGGEGGGRLYVLVDSAPSPSSSSRFGQEDESSLSSSSSPPLLQGGSSSSDCVSTTSEDSGTSSENGLPRIIKPRKRRKKERGGIGVGHESIVTLKPYQPLCYRYGGAFAPSPRPQTSSRGGYPYPPSPRCRCPHCVPPPSSLLTPPDSPVAEDILSSGKLFLASDDIEDLGNSAKSTTNAIVLTSSHPPTRPWIQVSNPSPRSSCTFTVMCYNILCDKYATRQMYGYCPNWALEWSYRKRNILNEIIHYKADIISLQEVETEQFYKYFLPELKKEGYDGIFSPKSRAKTMSESERKHVDGCAIFYKIDKFLLLKDHLVEFNQLAMANAEGSDDMLNRVMTKDNIGLAALLQTRKGAYNMRGDINTTTQTLLVCTAHIHWDPEYSDVKLIQTMMLMHELKSFVDDILEKCNMPSTDKTDPNIIPLLLCGDFNSLPDSGVIEYLSSGRVSTSHIDFKDIAYKDCLSKLGSAAHSNEFTHPFQITRAYNDGIMPFTNYSYDFKGVIDYVFYSKLHMNVLGVLGPIDSSWLEENHIHGCPHPHIPSDHFPIVVELQLYPTASLHPPPPNGVNLHG